LTKSSIGVIIIIEKGKGTDENDEKDYYQF
jgi:hypothetical protein